MFLLHIIIKVYIQDFISLNTDLFESIIIYNNKSTLSDEKEEKFLLISWLI
jgi:hypothetical protein